jgi:glycoside/pentoside/hexuronide:cation symporter, GPH family
VNGAETRLPATLLAAYALPAVPLAALTLPLYILVPTFYTETLGLPLAAVGFALLVIRLFDAINDPLVGWAADRFRPSFGRRRTLFALSLPVTTLAAFMLFWPPAGVTTAYLVGWGLVLSLGYTASVIPLTAWGAELSTSYRGRARLSGFREGFTLVGTLIAIALPFAIGFERDDGLHGLAALALFILIGLPAAGALAVWRVPEPREHSHQRLRLRDGLRHLAGNRPFLRLIAAYFLNGLANGIPATLFLYFVSDRLGVPEARGPLLFIYFMCGILGVPLALGVAGRLGKHRAWCLAMIANCILFVAAPLLPAGAVIAFGAICVTTGVLLGFDLALPAAIQADVIDVDTAASGEQRTATYFAAWSLTTKLSLALGVGVVFPVLASFGFDPQAGTGNSAEALLALAIIYAWVPIALKLAAVALMWNFPLDEAAQKRLRAEIEDGSTPTGAFASPSPR